MRAAARDPRIPARRPPNRARGLEEEGCVCVSRARRARAARAARAHDAEEHERDDERGARVRVEQPQHALRARAARVEQFPRVQLVRLARRDARAPAGARRLVDERRQVRVEQPDDLALRARRRAVARAEPPPQVARAPRE